MYGNTSNLRKMALNLSLVSMKRNLIFQTFTASRTNNVLAYLNLNFDDRIQIYGATFLLNSVTVLVHHHRWQQF